MLARLCASFIREASVASPIAELEIFPQCSSVWPLRRSQAQIVMQLYWTYISVLCISGHIAVKYLHYSRHRRGEFTKCPQSKNNKERSISLSLPFYEMTWGRRWFYCWNVESPVFAPSFSGSSNVAAFLKCVLIRNHIRGLSGTGQASFVVLVMNHSRLFSCSIRNKNDNEQQSMTMKL